MTQHQRTPKMVFANNHEGGAAMSHYRHLSKEEWEKLHLRRGKGSSLREITRELGRAASTIRRELQRSAMQPSIERSKVGCSIKTSGQPAEARSRHSPIIFAVKGKSNVRSGMNPSRTRTFVTLIGYVSVHPQPTTAGNCDLLKRIPWWESA